MGQAEAGSRYPSAPGGSLSVARFLMDECLHTSLVELAHAAGHAAEHVIHLGLGGAKDWQLMETILERDYTLATNNRLDFLALYSRASLHAGLVIIVPNVTPPRQRELFQAALEHIGGREIVNAVLEVEYSGDRIECREYPLPDE
jgi:predicted nuclease of predicted toxin-antitoxin system